MNVPSLPALPSLGRSGVAGVRRLFPGSLPDQDYWYEFRREAYQTAGGTAATADGDALGQVLNLFGGERHLTQATASKRFTLKTGENGLDGQPIGRADAVDDVMSATRTASATSTHFVVLRKRSAPSTSTRTAVDYGTSDGQVYTNSSQHATSWRYFNQQNGTAATLGGTATDWQLLVVRYNSLSSMEAWAGGVALATLDPNNSYSTSVLLAVGASGSLGANFGDYDYAALLGYTAAFSKPQINGIAAYFRSWLPSIPWSFLQ